MTSRSELSIGARSVVALSYLILLITLLSYFEGDLGFVVESGPRNLLFVATAVALVLGNYILEPFYSKPADVFVNSVGLFLTVIAFSPDHPTIGRTVLLTFLASLAVISFGLIALAYRWTGRSHDLTFSIVTRVGRSKVVYGIAYAFAVLSYFAPSRPEFWVLLAYLLAVLVVRPLENLALVGGRVLRAKAKEQVLGRVLRRLGASSIQYELASHADPSRLPSRLVEISAHDGKRYLAGVVSTQHTVVGIVQSARLIVNGGDYFVRTAQSGEVRTTPDPPRRMTNVFSLPEVLPAGKDESMPQALATRVDSLQRIAGVVATGSDSEVVLVDLFEGLGTTRDWAEGAVLECDIQNERCLLQVVSVQALESREVDNSRETFWRATCVKLGALAVGTGRFSPVPWVPAVGEVVFLAQSAASLPVENTEKSLVVGIVPGLLEELKVTDANRLVTHNAAVLGALGTGKTTLAIRLLADVVRSTEVRVVSIDVTREHLPLFGGRLPGGLVCELDAIIEAGLAAQAAFVQTHARPGSSSPVQDTIGSGNVDLFTLNVRRAICEFLFDAAVPASATQPAISGRRRVLVINPEDFAVTRGEKMGFQVNCVPLSTAEKSRVVSEQLLSVVMKLGVVADGTARVSLVLEEAHSLVPEYNFVAQDGDKAAANGTARVVLQGRKYGLGAMVIAQRTANVTKSILSQCATIVTLRIFDDTGRDFLSNFIGVRQAATLSQLADHHAVVVGAGIGSEQALMVKLPPPT